MRLIDADVLIEDIERSTFSRTIKEFFEDFVEDTPTVEAKPVVTGEWMGCDMQVSICSNCREVFDIPINRNRWNCCPNCGCDMRGEKHD